MPIKFEALKKILPEAGLKNFEILSESENEGRVLAGFGAETGDSDYSEVKAGVSLSLQESGEFVQIRLIKIIEKEKVTASTYRAELSEYLLLKNYENKIGRWSLDPSDGDVLLDWSIPIEDNDSLTERQLVRVFGALVMCVREAWAPMRRILETGSEKKLNADDLKKEILLLLASHHHFDLIPPVSDLSDVSRLMEVQRLVVRGDFEGVKKLFA